MDTTRLALAVDELPTGDARAWNRLLATLGETMDARATAFHVWDRLANTSVEAQRLWADPYTTSDYKLRAGFAYDSHYGALDYRMERAWSLPADRWHACHEIFSQREIQRTEFFNDYVQFHDARWLSWIRIELGQSVSGFLGVTRRKDSEPLPDGDMAALRALQSRLAGAVRQHFEIGRLRTLTRGALTALDAAHRPSVIVDRNGAVLALTEAAEAMARAGTLMGIRAGRLSVRNPVGAKALATAIRYAASTRTTTVLRLPGSGSKAPVFVVVAPTSPSDIESLASTVGVLVQFIDMEDARTPPSAVLRSWFGLTTREAELCIALAEGLTLAEHAERRGISRETARTQLRGVFDKTGTRRQIDLVRLLARLPTGLF